MPFTTLRKSTDHLFFLRNPEKIFLGTINYPIGKSLIVSKEFFIKLALLSFCVKSVPIQDFFLVRIFPYLDNVINSFIDNIPISYALKT